MDNIRRESVSGSLVHGSRIDNYNAVRSITSPIGSGADVPRSPFDYANFDIVTCETAEGTLELAVPRPDIPLVLRYINSRSVAPADQDS
jgi:hypothetical protein